jgi:hypothetical protein
MDYNENTMIKKDFIKERISAVIHMMHDKDNERYITSTGHINFNLVHDDLMSTIDNIYDCKLFRD